MTERESKPYSYGERSIEDMSDREFLHVVLDVAEEDGWSSSDDVRRKLGMPKRFHASSRLSWLQRFGAVEREYAGEVQQQETLGVGRIQRQPADFDRRQRIGAAAQHQRCHQEHRAHTHASSISRNGLK